MALELLAGEVKVLDHQRAMQSSSSFLFATMDAVMVAAPIRLRGAMMAVLIEDIWKDNRNNDNLCVIQDGWLIWWPFVMYK